MAKEQIESYHREQPMGNREQTNKRLEQPEKTENMYS
jgi:hypothetical protein